MNYKRLGDYIQSVNNRNKPLVTEDLRGLSMTKEFRKSTSNIVGVDLSKYKLVSKNQFACDFMSVIRVHKLPVVLHSEVEPVIVSPAYTVFKVIDEQEVLPEYLMMWFCRPEFDRYADFRCDSAIRGGFKWEELCDTKLPIPSIEKQRQIVDEYNTVTNRIQLNQKINTNLEATAQALYKHWFVDFEFPNADGKPYKADGGEMVYNEELDKEIPVGWSMKGLSSIAIYLNGAAMQKYPSSNNNHFTPVLKIRELNLGNTDENSDKASIDIPEKYKIYNGDIVFSWSGTLTIDIWSGGYAGLNQHLFKVYSNDFPKWYYYLSTKFYIEEFKRIADGNKTSMGHIKREHLDNSFVSYPNRGFDSLEMHFEPILSKIESNKLEIQKLKQLQTLLLAKMTQVTPKPQAV